MLIDIKVPVKENILILTVLILFNILVVRTKTYRIMAIRPIQVLCGTEFKKHTRTHIGRKYLILDIAVREVIANQRKYIALFLVSVLLAFFIGIVNNINAWTGRNGEGQLRLYFKDVPDAGITAVPVGYFQDKDNITELIQNAYKENRDDSWGVEVYFLITKNI